MPEYYRQTNKKTKLYEYYFPLDGKAIAKRMYETDSFVGMKHHGTEMQWLLRYMRDIGCSKEECKEKWIKISERPVSYLTDNEFNSRYMNCLNIKRFLKLPSIKIYESEIEYIKSLDTNIYTKEMALCLIAFCKTMNNWKFNNELGYFNFAKGWMACFMDSNIKFKHGDAGEALAKLGFIYTVEENEWIDEFGEKESDAYTVIKRLPEEGKMLMNSTIIYDVIGLFKYVKQKRCAECGKNFDITTDTKTDLCEECYKKKIKVENMNCKRNAINFIGTEMRVCEDCGKEFECSGNGKRTRCDECYKKYSKERHRKNALKSYHNKT